MKTRYWVLAFVVSGGLALGLVFELVRLLSPPVAAAAPLDAEQARKAMVFLDALDAGDFAKARAMTNAKVQEALPEAQMRKIWNALPEQLGGRKSRGQPRGEAIGGHPIVTVPFAFGLMTLDARVTFDADGLITGFWLVPAKTPAAAPEFVSNERFEEVAFDLGEGKARLPGTLALPRGQGPHAAVILVHGSGAHDRDETIGPNKPFRDLAQGLAQRGIAVLRYEKRNHARPDEFAQFDYDVNRETVDDAVAAIAALRADPRIDPARVYLAGHSLGAMMAPRIAQRAPELAGMILLAAPARPLQVVIPAQVRYLAQLDGQIDADEERGLAEVVAKAAEVDALDASADTTGQLLGFPLPYWRDLRDYDPVAVASASRVPLLLLQGERDYQVTVAEDLVQWEQALPHDRRWRLRRYPELNHLFHAVPGTGLGRPADYAIPGRIDERVVADIAQWVGDAVATAP